jgi:hypothetical protein
MATRSAAEIRTRFGVPDRNAEARIVRVFRAAMRLRSRAGAVRTLDLDRLPVDALAFYRPFHFSPHHEWGIYIMVKPLLNSPLSKTGSCSLK